MGMHNATALVDEYINAAPMHKSQPYHAHLVCKWLRNGAQWVATANAAFKPQQSYMGYDAVHTRD
jgi:hypothetical protein